MNIKLTGYILLCLFFLNCTEKKAYGGDITVKVNRFDKDLYAYLKGESSEEKLLEKYPDFLDFYGKQVIGIGGTDSVYFFNRLKKYFSHPSLMEVYEAELQTYTDISGIENELSSGFSFLQSTFDSIQIPAIYMHVSVWNQNIVVDDRFLSISADKYLGSEYKWYARFFYEYQRQNMSPDRVVPDYFLGFLMANFPFQGQEEVLLDRMIYEGKLRFILSRTLPDLNDAEVVGYNEKQESWCETNESQIWKTIISEKYLFNPDRMSTGKFINDAPYTSFLSDQSPGRVGIWVGYRIIQSYIKKNPQVSLKELMLQTDYQSILKASGYKP